jgi:hypothetical protein
MKRQIAAGCGVALAVLTGAAAHAAPKGGETFELACDNGETYSIVTNRGTDFTPGFLVDATAKLIVPTSFGDFHFTAVAPDGEVLVDETEPGPSKGNGKGNGGGNHTSVTCTFGESEVLTEDDPESGFPAGTTLTFSGEVTGFLVGR